MKKRLHARYIELLDELFFYLPWQRPASYFGRLARRAADSYFERYGEII